MSMPCEKFVSKSKQKKKMANVNCYDGKTILTSKTQNSPINHEFLWF